MRVQKELMLALNKIAPGFGYIDSRTVKCGSEHAYRLPMGKCVRDVEARVDTLVAAAGAPVELIDRGGAIVVRVVRHDFPARLQFNESDLRHDKLLIGYNRLMNPVYHSVMHLLAGGASGAGKTVWLRFILYQLARMGAHVNICDLKGFSFMPFESVPNFTVAKSLEESADLLHRAAAELERREQLVMRTRNRAILHAEPYHVVVIDEAAQIAPKMYSSKEKKDYAKYCDETVARLAQKGREPKVLLIYCTQRPDASIINGQVKGNVEAAVAFRTYTEVDSRIILGTNGAERISAATPGRCIFRGSTFNTLQVPFISEDDREWDKLLAPLKAEVVNSGSSQRAESPRQYLDGIITHSDCDDETAGDAESVARSPKESVPNPAGARRRETGARGLPQAGEDMAAHTKRPAAHEVFSDEI